MTNKYQSIKEDEKNIFKNFINCFEAILLEINDIYEKFKKQYNSEKLFDEALKFDQQNILVTNDIIDDCVWLIQKNEPRANHLRFFIAIISSCNNLKRSSAYIVNFAKFYYKENEHINEHYLKEITKIFELTITHLNKLFNIINKWPIKIDQDACTKIFNDFLKIYKKYSNEIILNTIKHEKKISSKFISALVIAIKNFDRYIDNTIYIIENFSSF